MSFESRPGRGRVFGAAVLDWGIGGTAAFDALRDEMARRGSAEPLLYLSDSGFAPYGRVPARALRSRLSSICAALARSGIRRLLVACNAMSSAIAPGGTVLREVRVEGMMREGPKAALALARKLAARRIVVLGGEATIRSGGWARPLRRARYSVAQRVAQPLSAIIERGEQDGPDFMSELRAICPPALPGDLVILACTHYPAGLRAFEEAMPGAAIFDPVAAVVRGFAGRSGFGVSSRPGPRPPVLALTTGAPEAAARAASLAFGLRLEFGALRSWEDLDESLRGAAP